MDPLNRLLDGLSVDVEPFALCEVRGSGLLNMGSFGRATLHYVIAGAGQFRIGHDQIVRVGPGSLLVVPAAAPHWLTSDAADGPVLPLCTPPGADWRHRRSGAGESGIIVACARIHAAFRGIAGLFDYLHAPILADLSGDDALRNTVHQLIDELTAPKPGSRALVRALLQQCLIVLLRRNAGLIAADLSWLAVARDRRLWRAVEAIFSAPAKPHTLQSLADLAGMSRSAFAEHFSAAFGRGPADLVKEMRLRLGAQLLEETDLPVKAIAEKAGYRSRSYFARAFHAAYGLSPAAYRDIHHG